jgi:hypothetical protein
LENGKVRIDSLNLGVASFHEPGSVFLPALSL